MKTIIETAGGVVMDSPPSNEDVNNDKMIIITENSDESFISEGFEVHASEFVLSAILQHKIDMKS